MAALLEYLVVAELSGDQARMNQYRIAVDVLGRDARFDPATDSIVRVEVGRLRSKLIEFYAGDGASDTVVFSLPKGTYRPVIEIRHTQTERRACKRVKQDLRFLRTSDRVSIAYATSGEGYPLVKAANWLSHLEYDHRSPVWRHWWEELSARFRLIRYDERGCGLSDWEVEDFSFDAWVRDLEEVVDAVGLERFALLGMSQGVAVSVAYAVRHPERVSHLILFGGSVRGILVRNDPKEVEQWQALHEIIRVGWGQPHGAFRQLFGAIFMPEASADQLEWFQELARISTSPENALRFTEQAARLDVADIAHEVRAPTLILHAIDEICVPFAQSKWLAARIPNAKLVPLDSKNHLLLEHEPAWQRFLEEVTAFVAKEEPTRQLSA